MCQKTIKKIFKNTRIIFFFVTIYGNYICKINPYLEIVGLKYNYYTGTKNSVVYMQVARLVCEKSTCVVSDLDGPHQMNKITKEQRQQYVYHGVDAMGLQTSP